MATRPLSQPFDLSSASPSLWKVRTSEPTSRPSKDGWIFARKSLMGGSVEVGRREAETMRGLERARRV